jgi:thioredoxin-related protein/TolA-binding protein
MNRLPAVLLLLPALLAPPGMMARHAEAIDWRGDYNKAVKEAADTGKPVLIVVGTNACYWCRQLDARTLHTPEVAKLLNERFVVYKLDANRQPELANAFKVSVYPSLYFAAPNGTILAHQEGFLEADALKKKLLEVLVLAGTPEWMQRDFELAELAVSKGDTAQALKLYRGVAEDGKSRPVQVKARQRMAELEKLAQAQQKKARELAETGKTAEALAELNKLDRAYPNTPAAEQGKELLVQLMSRTLADADPARDLLHQAKQEFHSRKFLACLQSCELLQERFPRSKEAAQAATLAAEIRSNPDWTGEAAEELSEMLASLYLSMADALALKGNPQQAIHAYERVVKMFPDSQPANLAKQRLTRLRGMTERK